MPEWPRVPLSSVARIYDGPHATPKKVTQGPWYLNIASLQSGRLVLAASYHISEADFPRWTRRVEPRAGDLLFSYETRIGDAALMSGGIRACLGRRMGLLRPTRGSIEPRFLLYAYLSPEFQETLRRQTIFGATVERLPISEMGRWEIPLPPRSEQCSIAGVLGALDDKIEINRHVEVTTWSLAAAHFEDLKAKPEDRVPLSSILALAYGKALPAASRVPGETPVYGSGGVVGWHNKPLVSGPGIIVGRKGTAGSVHWCSDSFFPIDTTFYVDNSSVPMIFAYFVLRSLGLDHMNADSAVPGLNRNTALSQLVPLPGEEEIASFSGLAETLVDAATAAAAENRLIAAIRDALLPKLLSGEVRVQDAEALAEEAT